MPATAKPVAPKVSRWRTKPTISFPSIEKKLPAVGSAVSSVIPEINDDSIIWRPTERQAEFLACDDMEVLYGGAAGGGKTDCLLIDALCLQHNGIGKAAHRALLFRRTYSELRDMISRSLELYQSISPGAKYNKTDKIWTFPSGATVEFGHLHNDAARFKYRGRAWNYIGFDELTLWSTSVCYEYLFSRLRTTDRTLPRYIRATTNPDGPGYAWVMKRWGIEPEGKATRLPVDVIDEEEKRITTIFRIFIPAKLSDNPHLAGTGYREMLLQMSEEDRNALLKGQWNGNKVKGAYYLREMQKIRANGGIRRVPYTPGEPVNTFWDFGMNDVTAIWFHQYVAGEHRFIHYCEASGETLSHYVAYMLKMGLDEHGKGTAWQMTGRHYLPHDAAQRSDQTGETRLQHLQKLGPHLKWEIIPRISDRLLGINQTRNKMAGNVLIDERGCADGIACLDSYRKKYNEKTDSFTDQHVHDHFSNGADAFRQWGQCDDMIIAKRPAPLAPKAANYGRKRAGSSARLL